MKSYLKFGLMILVSTVVMFAMMYLNVFQLAHIYYSQTRLFMALMMGAAMAIIMLLFMWKMYQNKKWNIGILIVSTLVFFGSLFMVRSQTAVDDVKWMKAMIPHHSIAILTSTNADIEDPEVKELAESIIQTQKEEIAEMKRLIQKIENGDQD